MLVTKKSNPNKPVRIMAYGVEGVGKSTLGAKSDHPVFITPEGGVDQLTDSNGNPCEEIPGINSWDALTKAISDLTNEKHDFKTVVLDSADWIEGLCHQKIIGTSGKTVTTVNGGYGTGYRSSQNMHQDLIKNLELLRDKRGMNIIITAHAHVKPVKDPEMTEDYDAFEIKTHEMVSSLWREWVDGLFFIRFKTFVKSDDTQRARAFTDGTRVLFTEKKPAFQAKNRYGMPEEMEFTEDFWNQFMTYAKKGVQEETAKAALAELASLQGSEKLDEKTRLAVHEAILKAGTNVAQLNKIKARITDITKGA